VEKARVAARMMVLFMMVSMFFKNRGKQGNGIIKN
jgi:hypothetical protein